MSKIENLEELLFDELSDLLNAENQLVKALPKMAEVATNPELKAAFKAHLGETRGHVERLNKAFELLGVSASSKTCQAMKGLVEEGDEAIEVKSPDAIRDAYLIGAAQRVEHYEMAAYGTARAFAEKLSRGQVVELLQQTLDEESAANEKLTNISLSVNNEAFALTEARA